MSYSQVIQHLGFGEELIECALGRPKIPLISYVSPAQWYVFPPALVPLASNGSGPGYYGLWAHWFSERKPSFVSMSVENRCTVSEIARTVQQFATYIVMKAIVESDGRNHEIDAFALAMGIEDVAALDRSSLVIGDDVSKFSQLSAFNEDCPMAVCANGDLYDGDFPWVQQNSVLGGEKLADCSPFEMEPSARRAEAGLPSALDWWKELDKPKLFDSLMVAKNHRAAWLTLNSSGWTVARAREALTRLVFESKAPGLQPLQEAWCAIAVGADISY
jgi:hypothetical protein